jgi:uncharacterized protein (TIRG00374 family)
VIRAFGIGSETVSTVQVLIAFGLIRLVTALTPIPGGIGINEVGTAALLIGFGGPETTVLAAVVTFRAITFLLPIFIGGACFALWRWRGRSPLIVTRASGSDLSSREGPHRSPRGVRGTRH